MIKGFVVAFLLVPATAFVPSGQHGRLSHAKLFSRDPRREEDTRPLAQKMFGDVLNLFSGDKEEEKVPSRQKSTPTALIFTSVPISGYHGSPGTSFTSQLGGGRAGPP